MTRYHVMIHGEQFLLQLEQKAAWHGFYQNFCVEAENPEEAEDQVMERLSEDEDLCEMTLNPEEKPPLLSVEEISELTDPTREGELPTGRAWYPEKAWWQFWKS